MSVLSPLSGVKRKACAHSEQMFSALPLKPDIAEYGRHVRFVPIAEVREVYISLFGRCSQTRMSRLILTFACVTGLPKFAYLIDAY